MKKLLTSVLCLMFAVAFMAFTTTSRADKPVCTFMTLAFLIEANKDRIVKIHTVEGEKFKLYLDKVNAMRTAKKFWPIEAVGMVIAEFKTGRIGTALVDKNACVVPGTVMAGNMAEMKEIFKVVDADHFFDVVGAPGA